MARPTGRSSYHKKLVMKDGKSQETCNSPVDVCPLPADIPNVTDLRRRLRRRHRQEKGVLIFRFPGKPAARPAFSFPAAATARRSGPKRGGAGRPPSGRRAGAQRPAKRPRSPPRGSGAGSKARRGAGPGGRRRHGRPSAARAERRPTRDGRQRQRRPTSARAEPRPTEPPGRSGGAEPRSGAATAAGAKRSSREAGAASNPERRATRRGSRAPGGAGAPRRSRRSGEVRIKPQPRSGKAGAHTFKSRKRAQRDAGHGTATGGQSPAEPRHAYKHEKRPQHLTALRPSPCLNSTDANTGY